MTIIYHTNFEQGSGQWEKIRCGKLTCSVLSSILTPAKLELSSQAEGHARVVAAERIKGKAEELPTNFDMDRGTALEEEARYLYHTRHAPVEQVAFIENSEIPFPFGYSPDGLIYDRRAGIEIKCPRAKGHLGTLLKNEIEGPYHLQMQGGMLAAELEFIDFLSYHEGLAFLPIRINRDETVIRKIIAAGKQFEQLVQDIMGHYQARVKAGAVETTLPEEIEL
jgi:hypothetical protein